jgi:hypothetical protein
VLAHAKANDVLIHGAPRILACALDGPTSAVVNIVWIIVIGFIAGFVARLLAPFAPTGIAARCTDRAQPSDGTLGSGTTLDVHA